MTGFQHEVNAAYDDEYYPDDDYYQEDYYPEQPVEEEKKAEEVKEKKPKKPKKNKPDGVLVEGIVAQFAGYFTIDQVRGTLIGHECDVELTLKTLEQRKAKEDKKGKGNIKKQQNEKAEKERQEKAAKAEEEEKQAAEKKQRSRKTGLGGLGGDDDKYDQKKENTEVSIYDKIVNHDILNAEHPTVDYQANQDDLKIDTELMQRAINMVIIGNVDSGKSTLCGQLLYQLGEVNKQLMHKTTKQADEIGKGSFKFAFLMDADQEERERGITINTQTINFSTPSRDFCVIDCPGHADFLPNMIRGASQAECGILVLDSYGSGFESGMRLQTKEHAILARAMGVTQIVCAINKLDMNEWKEELYDQICQTIQPFLKSIGFLPDKIHFVPVSALEGINLISRDSQPDKLKAWYEPREPRCLLEIIDSFNPMPKRLKKPIRACVYDFYQKAKEGANLSGDIVSLKLQQGIIKAKDKLLLMPFEAEVTVKAIECQKKQVSHVLPGQICDMQLQFPGDFETSFIRTGAVLCDPKYPIYMAKKFKAKIQVYEINEPLTKGQSLEINAFSNRLPGVLTSMDCMIDPKTDEPKPGKPKVLKGGDFAMVSIKLEKRICLELFSNTKSMGRIALCSVESGFGTQIRKVVASGIIVDLLF